MSFDFKRMLAGELYLARHVDAQKRQNGKVLAQMINQTPLQDTERIKKLERQLFGATGEHIYVTPPLYVDYGFNTYVGENFYANFDCIFLDVNEIRIGNNVMLGPRVGLYTAGHPIDADVRISDLEFGLPITIGDNVWIGGSVVVNPGVTIGDNTIIASGAVVTKDVPNNVIYGGNPARLIRPITDEDKQYWETKQKEYHEAKQGPQ
ncbi:sugar O-acetyltransferase [Erysipelothrix sp. HDW6C]|uniref:sugar O-acetyltransferase n=1 Tax=Erysipelothrix sp. HDW6C TaxID=2714930 RepID=UPI001407745D|nr:sugar O-acetyltransferase [Erysipelothrix sp. HDW6C]QIK69359.1 sugar O-acetyltransferase [Erysipelothrix sp. HDW6C]